MFRPVSLEDSGCDEATEVLGSGCFSGVTSGEYNII